MRQPGGKGHGHLVAHVASAALGHTAPARGQPVLTRPFQRSHHVCVQIPDAVLATPMVVFLVAHLNFP